LCIQVRIRRHSQETIYMVVLYQIKLEQMLHKIQGEQRMKSFYHYMMKFRLNPKNDVIGQLARFVYEDHSFPKMADDYNEISSYLELNGDYTMSMSVFDEAWELYEMNQ